MTKPETKFRLLGCPFCGAESAKLEYSHSVGGWTVQCQWCFARSGFCMSEKQAVTDWNIRFVSADNELTSTRGNTRS